jgi:hypothetical protein
VDIANGDHTTDESISEEIIDPQEDTAKAAEEETRTSEIRKEASIHQYLDAALSEIKEEIRLHKQPACYQRGDFYHRPKHPVFALHDAVKDKHGLNPDRLYCRDIFVWLPMCLPGTPDKFRCTCGSYLTKTGKYPSYIFILVLLMSVPRVE